MYEYFMNYFQILPIRFQILLLLFLSKFTILLYSAEQRKELYFDFNVNEY